MPRKETHVISHWHNLVDDYATSTTDFYTAVEEALKAREIPDVSTERVLFKEGGVVSANREYLRVRRAANVFDICAAPYGRSFFFSWWLAKEPKSSLPWIIGMLVAGALATILFISALFKGFALKLQELLVGGAVPNPWGGLMLLIIVIPLVLVVFFAFLHNMAEEGTIDEEALLDVPIIGFIYDKIFSPLTYYRLDTALMFQESVSRAVNEVIQGLRSEQGLRALTPEELKPTSNLFGR